MKPQSFSTSRLPVPLLRQSLTLYLTDVILPVGYSSHRNPPSGLGRTLLNGPSNDNLIFTNVVRRDLKVKGPFIEGNRFDFRPPVPSNNHVRDLQLQNLKFPPIASNLSLRPHPPPRLGFIGPRKR